MKLVAILFLLISFSVLAQAQKKALVIIDMQSYYINRLGTADTASNKEKVRRLIAAQLEIIEKAKKDNLPIIIVTMKKHGEMDKTLSIRLKDYPNKFEMQKSTNSMFDDMTVKNQLQGYLKKEGISDLIITGANGGACVFSSIYSALAYNYNVHAISDTIADFNYKEFIYPYEYSVQKFYRPNNCKRCEFEEMTSAEASEKLFSSHNEISINQSDRNSIKEISEEKSSKPLTQASKQ